MIDDMLKNALVFNPWFGCAQISPGCYHCYAINDPGCEGIEFGNARKRRKAKPMEWVQPYKWNESAKKTVMVICGETMDWLDADIEQYWLEELLTLIKDTPKLLWFMQTKRPQNWGTRISAIARHTLDDELKEWLNDWIEGNAPHNVWLACSVETQRFTDKRLPAHLSIPSVKHVLMFEPLKSPIYLEQSFSMYARPVSGSGLWIICGGEYGEDIEEAMEIEHATNLLEQCREQKIPFYMRQVDKPDTELEELPEELQVREIPNHG